MILVALILFIDAPASDARDDNHDDTVIIKSDVWFDFLEVRSTNVTSCTHSESCHVISGAFDGTMSTEFQRYTLRPPLQQRRRVLGGQSMRRSGTHESGLQPGAQASAAGCEDPSRSD